MRRFVLFVFFLILREIVFAYEFRVISFTADRVDLAGRLYEKRDANDQVCAIIKIMTDVPDIKNFESNLGIVHLERKSKNEIWIWVSRGEKRLRLTKDDFIPLEYDIPIQVESSMVYKMVIQCPEYVLQNAGQYGNTGKVADYLIESDPPGATISILGFPDFNEKRNKTPFTIRNFLTGPKIVTIALEKHDTIVDTIFIGNQRKISSGYKLAKRTGYLNFTLSTVPPGYTLLIDGDTVTGLFPGTPYELDKGMHTLEVRTFRYYPEVSTFNIVTGSTKQVQLTMRPITGNLTVAAGPGAEGAVLYLNTLKLEGQLPIRDMTVQVGDYSVTAVKPGYEMNDKELAITIREYQTTTINIEMSNTKKIKIRVEPSDVTFIFDGKMVGGSSPYTMTTGIGLHKVKIIRPDYNQVDADLEVIPGQKEYYFTMVPIKYYLTVVAKSHPLNEKVRVGINNSAGEIGSASELLGPGKYSVKFMNQKNGRIITRCKVSHPARKNPVEVRIPSKWGLSLVNVYYSDPGLLTSVPDSGITNPNFLYDIIQLSFYGISFSVVQLQPLNSSVFPDHPILGSIMTNPEFRMGGNITPWFDVSLYANYTYSYTLLEPKDYTESTKANLSEFFYGGAVTISPWASGFATLTFKAGIKDSMLNYKIWDGLQYSPSETLHETGYFLQVGLNLLTSTFDGKILRLWRGAISDIGKY